MHNLLEKFAKRDLAKARKYNSIIVYGTKIGNITIQYSNREYPMVAANMRTAETNKLYQGKAAGAVQVLTESYDVI